MDLLCIWVISDGDGRFTGNEAIKFFAMSNLSRQELKQVLHFIYLFGAYEQGVYIERNNAFVD